MHTAFLDYTANLLGEPILRLHSVAGGDISSVYRLETQNQRFIIKYSSDQDAKEMFQAEKEGLDTMRQSKTIGVPEVFLLGQYEHRAFLIMEFIESKRPVEVDFKRLGLALASLHQCSAASFGLAKDNFIGSLSQSNSISGDWCDFYVSHRLIPQLELAKTKGLLSPGQSSHYDRIYLACQNLFPQVKPSLLHGDLWSGNYLIASSGIPFLIDPAIYFGHSEVDLAMTRLFGGFDPAFYASYDEKLPPLADREARCEIYQLYYLLVHLNLFGGSYYPSVKKILDRYFSY